MADLTHDKFKQAVTDLARRTQFRALAFAQVAVTLEDAAGEVTRTGEQIAQMGVDTETRGENHELAQVIRGQSHAIGACVTSHEHHTKIARATYDQVRASYDQVQEQYRRSPADLSNVKRGWLTPE